MLSFLRGLTELRSVDIKLGGTTNLTDLGRLQGVRYLELVQGKGLCDLGPIADMTGLQFLFSCSGLSLIENSLQDLGELFSVALADEREMFTRNAMNAQATQNESFPERASIADHILANKQV